ncbi:hypothetical protein K1728_05760 [Weissella confusa]|uniref:hypothetical protein n=1 Tax=Weissella confusa TaxID=1583 RepID=UPI001C6FB3C7|nr:hypothetical protein [Weissella confusa]QYU58905.1 hypothetical protein K1728_05760 [Weissella confusa]
MKKQMEIHIRGLSEFTMHQLDERAKEFNLSRSAFVVMLLDDFAHDNAAAKGIELSSNRLDNMVSVMNTMTKTFNGNNSEIVKALNHLSDSFNTLTKQIQEEELTINAKLDVLLDD